MSFKNWYEGETKLHEYDQDPESGVIIYPAIYTEYHWTAKVARACVTFYLKYWQFVWGTVIGVVGIFVSYLGLKR